MYFGGDLLPQPDAMEGARGDMAVADAAAPAAGASQADGSYSTTTVQEAGVDEPDFVKTDGHYLYTIAQGRLQIVDVSGPVPQPVGSMGLPGGGGELLLDGDRLLLLGTGGYGAGDSRVMSDATYPMGGSSTTTLTLVDVSDRSEPTVAATLTLDGSTVAARMVNGVARVVLRSQPSGLAFVQPEGSGLRAVRAAEDANRAVVEDSTIDSWLPYYTLDDRRGGQTTSSEGRLLDCTAVRHPEQFAGLGMLSVLSVDLGEGFTPAGATGIVAQGETVYASAERLYVALQRYDGDSQGPVSGEGIQAPAPWTQLHAFDITDPMTARYLATGEVQGRLLNQFSMSEHAGHLRVATTDDSTSDNGVSVLAQQGEELVEVGSVRGLGKGEQIYAVRFLGDLGYVVTFRQTDPLYTLDLADPANPRMVGELKIPGYSSQLHPVGEGLLLGIGQDATLEGQTTGLQLSLFDVSDPADPQRLQQVSLGQANSEAEHDHRAFLHWVATGLAVIPVQEWGDGTGMPFLGAVGYRIGGGALTEVGRTTQEDVGDDAYQAAIRRSLVVGDRLVTLSEAGVATSALVDLAPLGSLRF